MLNVKWGVVLSGKCKVQGVKCGLWSVECPVWSVKCGSAVCGV